MALIIMCLLPCPGIAGITRKQVWQARNTLALVEATLRFNATGNTVTPLVQRLVFQACPRAARSSVQGGKIGHHGKIDLIPRILNIPPESMAYLGKSKLCCMLVRRLGTP